MPVPGLNRNLVIGGIGLAVALLLLLALCSRTGEDAIGGEVAARLTADRLPIGPVARSIPPYCGVKEATFDRLVPSASIDENIHDSDRQTCQWKIGGTSDWNLSGQTGLEVKVSKHPGGEYRSPAGAAIDSFNRDLGFRRLRTIPKADPIQSLSGLAEEALFWHETAERRRSVKSHAAGTTIFFRTGNVVAEVAYGGADYKAKENARAEKSTLDGAIAVAREVATSMGASVPATSQVVAPETTPKTGDHPHACSLLPAGTVQKLTGGAAPRPDTHPLLLDKDTRGADLSGCGWGFNLKLEVASVADNPLGTGPRIVTRNYLAWHHDLRHRGVGSDAKKKFFSALTGLGDQAFIAYGVKEHGREAQVVFQVRHFLVLVEYETASGSRDDTLNKAHALAQAAFTALPK